MYTLIINPVAGTDYAKKTSVVLEDYLKAHNVPYECFQTERPGHATEIAKSLARRDDVTAVISVGGDGTAFEVACGLMNTDKPMGIVPVGTGNDFIKTTGTPKDPIQALEFILTHSPRPIDVGQLNDRLFLNVCGTGFDVMVLDGAEAYKAKYRGLTPYLLGLIKAIKTYHKTHVRVTYDGKTEEKDLLVCSVANGRFIGGGIPICPAAILGDGKLDLVMIDDVPRWKIPLYLPGLMMGKDLTFSFTKHVLCDQVSLFSEGMRLNVDGEILTMNEAEFRVLPGALTLFW